MLTDQQINYSQTGFRTTLYRTPLSLNRGRNRKIIFSFYNNDISHSLQIVPEGMTKEGRLLHLSKLLK